MPRSVSIPSSCPSPSGEGTRGQRSLLWVAYRLSRRWHLASACGKTCRTESLPQRRENKREGQPTRTLRSTTGIPPINPLQDPEPTHRPSPRPVRLPPEKGLGGRGLCPGLRIAPPVDGISGLAVPERARPRLSLGGGRPRGRDNRTTASPSSTGAFVSVVPPSCSPSSEGETRPSTFWHGQSRDAIDGRGDTPTRAETSPPDSLLQREKDRKRGWRRPVRWFRVLQRIAGAAPVGDRGVMDCAGQSARDGRDGLARARRRPRCGRMPAVCHGRNRGRVGGRVGGEEPSPRTGGCDRRFWSL